MYTNCSANLQTLKKLLTFKRELSSKNKSEIYARHVLSTRIQQAGETLDQYLQALYVLAKNCKGCNRSKRKLLKMTLYPDYLYFLFNRDSLKIKSSPSQKLKIQCKMRKGLSEIRKPVLLISKQVIKQHLHSNPQTNALISQQEEN